MKHIRFIRFVIAAVTASLLLAPMARAEMVLFMVEAPGCHWCARWHEEIAPIYPKTPEGQAAPLQRIDLRDRAPEGMVFARSLQVTPTFVLMQDGQERGRIEGYPGEDFFWGLLGKMIGEAQAQESAG